MSSAVKDGMCEKETEFKYCTTNIETADGQISYPQNRIQEFKLPKHFPLILSLLIQIALNKS